MDERGKEETKFKVGVLRAPGVLGKSWLLSESSVRRTREVPGLPMISRPPSLTSLSEVPKLFNAS